MSNTLVSYVGTMYWGEGLWRSMAYGEVLNAAITFLGQVLNESSRKNDIMT